MHLIQQSVHLQLPPGQTGVQMAKACEYAARNCYASQDRITDDSYKAFLKALIQRGHTAPLEFGTLTYDFTTSRAVLAEITRHRLASFCVESQRYIQEAQTGDISFIFPSWYFEVDENDPEKYKNMRELWLDSIAAAEDNYKAMIECGAKPEEAREVLPNSTACRIIMSANLREWKNIFSLRCGKAAYPQMRALASEALLQAWQAVPVIFDDLYEQYIATKPPDQQQ